MLSYFLKSIVFYLFLKVFTLLQREARLLKVRSMDAVRQQQMLSQSIYLIFDVAPQVSSLYVLFCFKWEDTMKSITQVYLQ